MDTLTMPPFSVTNIFKRLPPRTKPLPPIPQKVWEDPWYFIAFGFGSGTMPFAPGTFGTLFAIPFYLLLQPLSLGLYIVFVLVFIVLSSWLCDRVSRDIHTHDHPGMCIDEFAGYFVTMIQAPSGWPWVAVGFVLFRLFDIWKPWPIRLIDEKVHGGFGMVLDDVIAGIFALFCIQLLSLFT